MIAKVFYRRGVIESWGSGIKKILRLTQEAGLPKPSIDFVAGAVTVRFLPSRYVPPTRTHHDLTDIQRQILDLLNRQTLSLSEILALLGEQTSRRSLKDDLALLNKLELIVLIGRGRGARWKLK
jgi:ATP-dependent DNA helicase RecG